MKTAIALLALLCATGGLGFFLYFGAALSQERDTPEILKSALQMELGGRNVVLVNGNRDRLLVRSFDSLRTHLEQQGWTWEDQFGAVTFYRKDNQRVLANCGMYSRRYMLCDLTQTSQVKNP
ncbi:hypothetical protein IQ250_30595 [Pseudanabaenaceae cyanobacterium LEGE 13415]|nr:hypothetical protein [Pseudanabaenaceae cyanobacterium LEGE 13415]